MNVLVTGGNGQLGLELQRLVKENLITNKKFYFTDVNELDITDNDAVFKYLSLNKINKIINCAAYTAVDKAESEPQQATQINTQAVLNIAGKCKTLGIGLIHVSTDFVFDGKTNVPYLEDDSTKPLSIYAKTKLEGEVYIKELVPTYFIIRTSWLYSEFGNNFVKTIMRLAKEREELKVVCDQIGTPTYARDLASVILKLLDKLNINTKEIFHYSNEGVASWYDFAKEVVALSKNLKTCKVLAISTKEYPTPAERPKYSVMSKSKIKKYLKIEIPDWKHSLKDCMESFK